MRNKRGNVYWLGIFFLIAFFIIGFGSSQIIGVMNVNHIIDKFTDHKQVPQTEQDIINDCEGLGVQETSLCLRDNVKTFYDYSETSESHSDLKTLKERGGDCYNYAEFYKRMGMKLGFNSETQRYDGIDSVVDSHRWAVLWDGVEYCKIDLLEVRCRLIEK